MRMKFFSIYFFLLVCNCVNSAHVVKLISPKDIQQTQLKIEKTGRIVAGNHAIVLEFPYQVSIRAVNGSNGSFCGGSIISSRYVLTAAHCTKGFKSFELGFGSSLLERPLTTMTSRDSIEHPQFESVSLRNDIALIKLPLLVRYTKKISPIQLPKRSQVSESYINQKAVVSGFGRFSDESAQLSKSLSFADLRVIGNRECAGIFSSKIVTNNVLCARSFSDSNENACMGDSGGPLAMKDEDGILTQIGIVSFVSSRGCLYGDPSGYTRVGKYLDWISEITGIPLRK
ncbi:CLUMA_CG005651, isoform A [Clunio marinus]|uniref:CLUMA_CG005651, isoform A n=1 Tax=Clunio marinus TaxID=568069 RepID=A0A1J1HVG8_9DIPT|nr:CLUMA_CG005651, isoform A [Clunio marinus]